MPITNAAKKGQNLRYLILKNVFIDKQQFDVNKSITMTLH